MNPDRRSRILLAASLMDWQQVILNAAAPCFHICEDGRFCGRAARWGGHKQDLSSPPLHRFVSLSQLLAENLTP